MALLGRDHRLREVFERLLLCDDSPNRHATRHFGETGHRLVRSLEPGEQWSYCYIDETGLFIPQVRGTTAIPPSPLGGEVRALR
jgi:hypothetical protein